jgi:hypothetical protein
LSAYVTIAGLSLTLASYVTTSDLTTNYTTTAALTTLLAAKQAAATVLTNLSAISWVAGDLITFSGANAPARIAKGTKSQVLRMDNAGGVPIWDSLAYIDEANWQTAGWQTLSGTQGIANGSARGIRGMFFGGTIGVGLNVIGVTVPGTYRFCMRFYIAGGQNGRMHVYKGGGVELGFLQFTTQNTSDTNAQMIQGTCSMQTSDYFYLVYDGGYNCYHAQEHTAFSAWWIAPP